uniref:Retinal-binding protein n=1 Tax=Cacopsylla melanoneura TaxID=428564 RepID=A0A8D8QV54_9HEMI
MIDDNTVRQYLIGSKGNVEKAKQKLDDRSSVRHDIASFFTDRDVTSLDFENSCRTTNMCMCPQLTREGCRLTFLEYYPDGAPLYTALADLKRLYMLNDLWIRKGRLYTGEDVVLDMKHYSDKHRDKLGLQTLLQWINTLKMMPTRLNRFIIINAAGFIETLFKLVRPFLSEKLQSRFFIYSRGSEALLDHFTPDQLPKDMGGTCEYTIKEISDYWTDELKSNAAWISNDANFLSNEAKRVGPRKSGDSTFGVEGTFRKINID